MKFQNKTLMIISGICIALVLIMGTFMVSYFMLKPNGTNTGNTSTVVIEDNINKASSAAGEDNTNVPATEKTKVDETTQITETKNNPQKSTKQGLNEVLLAKMKKKNENLFTDMTRKMDEDSKTVKVTDGIAEIDNVSTNTNKLFYVILASFQRIPPVFIVLMTIFGFIMSWLYKTSPLRSKGWIIFAIGAPLLYIFAIYGVAIYSSFTD